MTAISSTPCTKTCAGKHFISFHLRVFLFFTSVWGLHMASTAFAHRGMREEAEMEAAAMGDF